MSFHPNSKLPDCMMPDGGDCCTGHAALVDDWRKLRSRIEQLEAALDRAVTRGLEQAERIATLEALYWKAST